VIILAIFIFYFFTNIIRNFKIGSPFKIEVTDNLNDANTATNIKSVCDEKSDKRIIGALVGCLNIMEFDGTNIDGKLESIVNGIFYRLLIFFKDFNINFYLLTYQRSATYIS
jgi:hypothetical protein